MKKSTIDRIKDSIKNFKAVGGLNNPEMKKVIVKLKKACINENRFYYMNYKEKLKYFLKDI